MFRLLKLSPPHGWRAVSWELAIVTLGVLIALWAGELLTAYNWKSKAAAGERALTSEAAWGRVRFCRTSHRGAMHRCPD
jgi:hypothetical protein